MKHIIFCLTVIWAISQVAIAAPVSRDRARIIASQHMLEHSTRHYAPGHAPTPSLALTARSAENPENADLYVFNTGEDAGYVIVAGDDLAPAVLGYSDKGSFDPADVPDGLQYMLDVYRQEMQLMRQQPSAGKAPARQARSQVIRPLLTSNWNQNAPYNDLCPTYTDGNGTKRSVTGCVATATAQIMYYYRWPNKGTGTHSYTCNVNNSGNNQTLSADFGSTTYHWGDMLDEYSNGYNDIQANAVATLMYHVGVSGEMKYGAASGMSLYSSMEALRNYFGYSKDMRYVKRAMMSITEWQSTIDTELQNGRPVLYSGYTSTGGHAFVFDGCDANGYYHINWGWGGSSNGYFLVTALNPKTQGIGSYEGGYNNGQEMIVGIQPDNGAAAPEKSVELTIETFKAGVDHVTLGSTAALILDRLTVAGNGFYPKVNVYILPYLTDENGQDVEPFNENNRRYYSLTVGSSYRFTTLDVNSTSCIRYTPSTSLADGNYQLWIMYCVPSFGMTEYIPYNHSSLNNGYINARVSNGVMYFDAPEITDGNLLVTRLDYPETVGTGNTVEVTAYVHNNDDKEYYDVVNYVVLKNGQQISYEQGQRIDVAAGDDVITKGSFSAPTEPGDYQLLVVDRNNAMMCDAKKLKVLSSANYNLAITTPLTIESYKMPQGQIKGQAVISNTGQGDFVGSIPYMVLDDAVTSVLYHADGPTVHIPAGGSATVNIQSPFEGTPGVVYKLCLRRVDRPTSYSIWGSQIRFEVLPFYEEGDVNSDGEISIADVTMLVNLVLTQKANVRSDVNNDHETGVADITKLITILLEKEE